MSKGEKKPTEGNFLELTIKVTVKVKVKVKFIQNPY